MEKPCQSDHGDYREGCAVCWKWKYDPAFQKFHGGAVATPDRPAARPARTAPCVHFGAQTGEVECRTCGGKVSLKVFACAIHQRCTIGKRTEGVAGCCQGCADYATVTPDRATPAVPGT